MAELWYTYAYQPLFNLLIYIYNNFTDQNLGWAIVQLTILLRFVLLPFTIIGEYNRVKNEQLAKDIEEVSKIYKKDPIQRKQEIRLIMKQRKVQPWSRVLVIGIQAVVLLLLYQVFKQGISGERMLHTLYTSVDFPGVVNTNFYGFELGKPHDALWSGAVALWLFMETYVEFRKRGNNLTRADLMYFMLFPTAVFIALWVLPMSKSLFVFTSMLFSAIIGMIFRPIFRKPKKA